MGLVCNGYRLGFSPFRHVGGALVSIYGASRAARNMGQLPGRMRGIAWLTDNDVALPLGSLAPSAWMLPQKPGAMASHNAAVMTFDGAGLAVGGITTTASASFALAFAAADILPADDTPPARTASASFTITFATAAGSLITSGAGAASFAFSSAAELLGILSGAGAASFALIANTPLLGAEASLTGAATWTLTAAAAMLPADDDPPARTAAASFSFSGALLPYAIGSMVGSTITDADELTADAVAAATVAALQATAIPVDVQKVRGQDLEGTGIEADPWGPA